MRAAFALVLLALVLAGCAAGSKAGAPGAARVASPVASAMPPPMSPLAPPPGVAHAEGEMSYGTIIAERAVDPPAGAGAIDVRANIMTAIGTPQPAAPASAALSGGDPPSGPETEFIIREDDGGTISVVEGDAAGFRRGERVMIIRGPETKLAPLGQA